MKRHLIQTLALVLLIQAAVFAHGGSKNIKLHVNPKWKECSFQIDPSLTQKAWHQFTREAGLVGYFRPLNDAKPMGRGNYELSIFQGNTGIDDADEAWNNTFVHPDSTHWLYEGDGLKFPAFLVRAGITDRIDAGFYFTKNPNANYGFYGAQMQYNFMNDAGKNWATSARLSFVSLFGPKDLDFTVYGVDVVTSKKYTVSGWASVSPYIGISTYLASSHEKTAVVNLKDENVLGMQAMVGAMAQISIARLSVEYNIARVNSLSFKIGVGF